MMRPHNKQGGILMDLYGNRVIFNQPTTARTPVRAVTIAAFDVGPIGCPACTSGDSPLFDFEQNILFGQ